ncbi:tyrosine-type recombinase/integrase [Microbacterium terrisoli]|uniref:tyrosine-type recombinase/integrase n=1 Tax=Microbacterium terrisoli TaxID=3242192 RepID=UPI0028058320|nr:site-specific integrase [Microbacterium protaetiae]
MLEARQNPDANDTPTLRAFTAHYLDPASGLLTGVTDGTRHGYERIAALSFLNVLGDYPVNAIGKEDVGRWIAWQEKQPSARRDGPVSAKTLRNYHALLSAVLASAVDLKHMDSNPAYRTRLSEGVRREGVFLTRDEFATILHFIPQRYEGLFLFLAGTGCRWGEATALTWGNVDLTAHPPTARIEKAWKKGPTGRPVLAQPKSKRGRRTVSLSADVVDAMGTPRPADQLVFRGPLSGTHLWYGPTRSRVWEPAVQKAQDAALCAEEGLTPIRKTPHIHDLRHSHASWLIARGVPLPYVQARLGHESINTTVGVYGHLQPDAHVQMADIVTEALEGVRPLRQVTT